MEGKKMKKLPKMLKAELEEAHSNLIEMFDNLGIENERLERDIISKKTALGEKCDEIKDLKKNQELSDVIISGCNNAAEQLNRKAEEMILGKPVYDNFGNATGYDASATEVDYKALFSELVGHIQASVSIATKMQSGKPDHMYR